MLIGKLADHLMKTPSNEAVLIETRLCRGCPPDAHAALRLFQAIARTNRRTKRDILHMKVSPSMLTSELAIIPGETGDLSGLEAMLALIEREHGIPPTTPRFLIRHRKGDRPDHWHPVYAIVDPETGAVLKSHDNYFRDELISRQLEVLLGELITPGTQNQAVAAELHRRASANPQDLKLREAARMIGQFPDAIAGERLHGNTRQHVDALGLDASTFQQLVYGHWIEAKKDWSVFQNRLTNAGMAIASGDQAMLVVDDATGASLPLLRALNAAAKAAKDPDRIRKKDINDTFPDARPFEAERDTGLERAQAKAREALEQDFERLIAEAEHDQQGSLAERLRKRRSDYQARQKHSFARTLKARRTEIDKVYRERLRVQRARVNRAFLAAKWLDNPTTRKIAFTVAGTGMLMAGGGFGLALLAGGLAMASLPTFDRARALKFRLALRSEFNKTEQKLKIRNAYKELMSENRATATAAQLSVRDFTKIQRIAAAGYQSVLLFGEAKPLNTAQKDLMLRSKRILGLEKSQIVETAFYEGSFNSVIKTVQWFNRNTHHFSKRLNPKHVSKKEAAVNERWRYYPHVTHLKDIYQSPSDWQLHQAALGMINRDDAVPPIGVEISTPQVTPKPPMQTTLGGSHQKYARTASTTRQFRTPKKVGPER